MLGIGGQDETRFPRPGQVIGMQRQHRAGKELLGADHRIGLPVGAIQGEEMLDQPPAGLERGMQLFQQRQNLVRPDMLQRADGIDLVVGRDAQIGGHDVVQHDVEAEILFDMARLFAGERIADELSLSPVAAWMWRIIEPQPQPNSSIRSPGLGSIRDKR